MPPNCNYNYRSIRTGVCFWLRARGASEARVIFGFDFDFEPESKFEPDFDAKNVETRG